MNTKYSKNPRNTLGPAVKYIRKHRKMTQATLGEKTGLAQNSVSGHENQWRIIDEADITAYADALMVKQQTLFDVAKKLKEGEPIDDKEIEIYIEDEAKTIRDTISNVALQYLNGKEFSKEESIEVLEKLQILLKLEGKL